MSHHISATLEEYSIWAPSGTGDGSYLLLMRHCDVHNPNGVVYEKLPGFGLSALGHSQAKQLGRELADVSLEAVYSGPLERAVQTATLIKGQRDIPLVIDDALDEVESGELAHTSASRVQDFLHRVTDPRPSHSILVVTHRAVIHEALQGLGLTLDEQKQVYPATIVWIPLERVTDG